MTPTIQKSPDRPASLGLKLTFIFLYDFGGKALATSTQCKDFELEKHESEALAQQSDDLIVEFFPTVQSRWVKLIIFIGSVLGIFGKKYLSYLEKTAKPKNSPTPDSDYPIQEAPKSESGVIPINPLKRF